MAWHPPLYAESVNYIMIRSKPCLWMPTPPLIITCGNDNRLSLDGPRSRPNHKRPLRKVHRFHILRLKNRPPSRPLFAHVAHQLRPCHPFGKPREIVHLRNDGAKTEEFVRRRACNVLQGERALLCRMLPSREWPCAASIVHDKGSFLLYVLFLGGATAKITGKILSRSRAEYEPSFFSPPPTVFLLYFL